MVKNVWKKPEKYFNQILGSQSTLELVKIHNMHPSVLFDCQQSRFTCTQWVQHKIPHSQNLTEKGNIYIQILTKLDYF